MSASRRRAIAALVIVASSIGATAHGAPSIWQRAVASASSSTIPPAKSSVDPLEAHRAYADILYPLSVARADAGPAEHAIVLAKLDAAIAVSSDVRLRFDRGDLLKRMGQCALAKPELEAALAIAPTHVFAPAAWFDLAICAGLEARHADEERAYVECLALSLDVDERAIAWSNLGESRMAVGRLDEAVAAFEAGLALRSQMSMTWWNLAVARDRQGNDFAAMRAARIAQSIDPGGAKLASPDVFFEPPAERWWYAAIVALTEAEDEPDRNRRAESYEGAAALYAAWSFEAPSTSPYRARAAERSQRLEARARAAKTGK